MMQGTLEKLSVKGFKSIGELKDFPLNNLNVFVGANGAGKSNLMGVIYNSPEAPESLIF